LWDFIDREFDGLGFAIVVLLVCSVVGGSLAAMVESIASIWRCR